MCSGWGTADCFDPRTALCMHESGPKHPAQALLSAATCAGGFWGTKATDGPPMQTDPLATQAMQKGHKCLVDAYDSKVTVPQQKRLRTASCPKAYLMYLFCLIGCKSSKTSMLTQK